MPRTSDRSRRRKPEYQVKIAKERIMILLSEAEKARKEHPELARRYYHLAKKIGMRYNVGIPKSLKRKFCKYCFSYITEGWRFKKGRMYTECKYCKKKLVYPYKPTKTPLKRHDAE